MALTYDTLADLLNHGYDTVIDVRSPAEFAEDHVPGAINLPALDNDERARVGTIYKQDSPFKARKLGAALVFRNVARHIEDTLSHHDGGWRPLVYCWRGGQRSGTFAWTLKEIGWRSDTVAGGYRSFRRLVHAMLYETELPHRLVALDGYTGTAKTDLLHRLRTRGVQVLDLEGLANHRGSVLGGMGDQPTQKWFETGLSSTLSGFDPARPVVVEAESSKIGSRIVPPAIWEAMKIAPRIEVEAPVDERVTYLTRVYDDILSDTDRLHEVLPPLIAHRGREVVEGWLQLIDAGDKQGFTRAIVDQHYDPSYQKSRRAIDAHVAARVQARTLDDAGLDKAAADIEKVMEQIDLSGQTTDTPGGPSTKRPIRAAE
ncbi:tRNA 2-selenouridine(34) synthase MnmH [Chachezhania antarctica]|uniref:tRNA 2-selenouridine(34) synthase MnmH n=1 Tax=Chachezhania antarctica TaxID=2340860 RepID=UPI000EB2E91B|nr:tRNA 2-selenouridine(34) synthase MnmH [Chachezhania antarctica]|tara:strand:+ start:2136 stop:3254 length:1119 start_codon:yes stop_codon:yes gene_type:complete